MDKRQERIKRLLHTLTIYQTSTISELAKELDVSEMTVRRDLKQLSHDAAITVLHGGVVYNPRERVDSGDVPYSLITASTVNVEQKKRIGQKAATLIEAGDIVVIDGGSTTEYIARNIPSDTPITVLCYSLNILFEVTRKNLRGVIFPGGYFHENIRMFESAEGVHLIRKNRANKAFIAASGVTERLGATIANHYEIEMKKAAMESSLLNILVIDSSKFGRIGPAYLADLKDFGAVITDEGISDEYRQIIKKLGLQLYVV